MQRYEKNRFPGNLFTNHWFSTRLGRMQQLFLSLPKNRMSIKKATLEGCFSWRRDRDSNPGTSKLVNGFRDRPDRPLRHLSL